MHVDDDGVGAGFQRASRQLAVDRGNARLAPRYNPFHPSVLRLLRMTADAGREAGIEVSVCGEIAANPLAVFLMLGLGITSFSVSASALPEIKKVIRSVPYSEARTAAAAAVLASTPNDVVTILTRHFSQFLDLSLFSARWNLPTAS